MELKGEPGRVASPREERGMHKLILNTPQQLGGFYSLLGKEHSALQQCFKFASNSYLLEVLLSPEDTAQNTNHRWFLSQPGLVLLQTHLLRATAHQAVFHPPFRASAMAGFKAFLLFFVPLAQRGKQQD